MTETIHFAIIFIGDNIFDGWSLLEREKPMFNENVRCSAPKYFGGNAYGTVVYFKDEKRFLDSVGSLKRANRDPS